MTNITINVMPYIIGFSVSIILLIGITVLIISLVIRSLRRKEEIRAIHNLTDNTKAEFYILDIRTYEEYCEGHLPGAISIPLEEIESFFPTDEMFTDIIVYGRDDRTSRLAADFLSDTAYFCVRNLGNINHWDGELEKGSGITGKELLASL